MGKTPTRKPLLFSMLATLMLTFGLTGAAWAAPDSEQEPTAQTAQTAISSLSAQSGDYPSSFDLRNVDTDGDGVGDRCFVTPVKCQYPYGTCWGFAATAAAETNILSTVLYDDPDAWKTLDLSEKQLAYFAHWYVDDPSSSQNGEGTYSLKENPSNDDIYNGGSVFLGAHTYAAGVGPTNESNDEALEYHGKDKIAGELVITPTFKPYSYLPEDDWSLSDEYRIMQDFVLKESYMLPSPASRDENFQYKYDGEATEIIKQHIMELNAVTIGFHADTSRPTEAVNPTGEYMSAETWAHYTYKFALPNHAVAIIGWDDNFPKDKFINKEGVKPPADGAWLVKNSWGSGENEFPNRGTGEWGIKNDEGVHTGYFWLSYYDRSITDPEVLIFDTSLTLEENSPYDPSSLQRDQYDLMPAGSTGVQLSDEEMKSANVFKADKTKHVMAISYEVAKEHTQVHYEVYLLDDEFASPEDGKLMASGSAGYERAGFYMAYLETAPVVVQEGQSYSIVVTQRLSEGDGLAGQYALNMPTGLGKDSVMSSAMGAGVPQYQKGVVNEGESFVYTNGAWTDWSNEDVRYSFLGDISEDPWAVMNGWTIESMDYQFDNFPIKGYVFDAPDTTYDVNVRLAGDTDGVTVCKGGTTTVELELYGNEADQTSLSDYIIDWSLDEGSDAVVGLTPGEDETAQLVWKSAGNARLFATVKDVGTVIVHVAAVDVDHVWGEPTYVWADDNSSCTATHTCTVCGQVESETVDAASEITKQPTATEKGTKTITATFKNAAFATQIKTEDVPVKEDPQKEDDPEKKDDSKGDVTPSSKPSNMPSTGDAAPVGLVVVTALFAGVLTAGTCLRRRRES